MKNQFVYSTKFFIDDIVEADGMEKQIFNQDW